MVDTEKLRIEVLGIMSDTRIWHSKRDEFKNMSKEEFVEAMENKFNYLYTNSSTLFNRCLVGDINMEQLNFMLAMLDKVNSGKDYQAVSQEVGQKLVDIYVKPLIDNEKGK